MRSCQFMIKNMLALADIGPMNITKLTECEQNMFPGSDSPPKGTV